MKVIIINGPNLNLLGKRERAIYGNISFDEYLIKLKDEFKSFVIDCYQSNIEGELINKLQKSCYIYDVVLLNAGGYTHTSVAIADCIKAIDVPVIEIHISNIYSREDYRRKSLISSYCKGVVCGLGLDSYKAALATI